MKEILKLMTMSKIAYIIGFVGTVAHGNHGGFPEIRISNCHL